MAELTFITNHTAVLLHIVRNERITAREIAAGTGISERAIRKIIADLTRDRYISKRRDGRHVVYTVYSDAHLPDFSARDVTVGQLLESLGWQRTPVAKEEKIPVLAGAGRNAAYSDYQKAEREEREEKSIENIYSQLF